MSTQPQWITAPGSLGTIPEGVFYQVPIQAVANGHDVKFTVIAGQLPTGIQVTETGTIEGTPRNILNVQGVPVDVSEDITSKFAIRAYTTKLVNGQEVVDRVNDRTFTITVTGQDIPEFLTPAGNVGTFYDGSPVRIQIRFFDSDIDDSLRVRILSGRLPPGLTINNTGLISGIIEPLVGPPGTAVAGYDATQYDQYPFDFSTRSASANYQFSVEITDGKDSNVRTFEIFVYSKDSMSADTTDFTADNTFITADVVPTRTPILITPPGSLGLVRSDNFYAFQFQAIDFDGDPIEYSVTLGGGIGYDADGTVFDENGIGFDRGNLSLPPGLAIDPATGWFYGYIPDQGATENTYRFAVRVRKANRPEIVSDFYFFTITIISPVADQVVWITGSDLGTISNGDVSTFFVEAVDTLGRNLQYRLLSGSNSRLPQGLTLLPSGNIVGRVSFNTFAIDSGTTTFDRNIKTRAVTQETTFDTRFNFTVNAFLSTTDDPRFEIVSFVVIDGGSGYTSPPTIEISAPPDTADSIQATAGTVNIVDGKITAVAVGNSGRGYTTVPTVTVTGGGGVGAIVVAQVRVAQVINTVSVLKTFTIKIDRRFNQPYQSLYIKAMPPNDDRAIINQLLQNQDIIPENLVYRADDPNFGVASMIRYNHAFGLTTTDLIDYVNALTINHYWKNLILGSVEVAQARDLSGRVIYEVIYSRVIDNLLNDRGESVSKQIRWPFTIATDQGPVNVVYPNSLINMRDQVFDTVGRVAPMLPLWMTSKQADGRVLGFTPAWVIAYVKPGQGAKIRYNIQQKFGNQLNIIDFKADRYEIDRSMSFAWDPATEKWQPSPPEATTFDNNTTVFDFNSTQFITPANTVTNTDQYDKYVLYPRINILG